MSKSDSLFNSLFKTLGRFEATEKVYLKRKRARRATICRCSSSFYPLYIDKNVYELIRVNTFSAVSDGSDVSGNMEQIRTF